MKKLILPLLIILLVSCSKSESNPNIPKELLGKWQYVEFFGGLPDENGNYPQHLITDGYIVEYKADGTFTSTEGDDDHNFFDTNPLHGLNYGSYNVSSDGILTMIFINGLDTFTLNKKINTNTETTLELNLSLPPINCDEGCVQKLNKLSTIAQ